MIERFRAMLEAGDVEGMLTALFLELVEMPPEELELLRAQRDAWTTRLRNARTLPREMEVEESYIFSPERFREMRTPTLLLVGGDSPARELRNANGVAAALPEGRVAIMPGQQHAAMYAAPDLFVRAVLSFLRSKE
jgi:pimeloyl-ACP methyl ester carboxylesterase